jgi:DNA replication protein DnaC
MNVPPIAVRRGILENYLQPHHISADIISQLSQQPELSPAQIEKAAKIMKLTTASTAKSDRNANANVSEANEARLMLVIDNGMALLDQHKVAPTLNLAECSYQLEFLNPDCELQPLIQQLKQTPDAVGALCFYGAPGTGKTALAHFIAHEMALPLMLRRASDIITPYVGETEQRIAAMFKQAEQDGALLLLDEADSFLTDRKSARNSWEITAVNEMLTQMESFKGLFICSTNLMSRLDEASLRRFSLKIKFDYLKPEQRWLLFQAQIKSQSNAAEAKSSQPMPIEDECRAELRSLNNLTPGDFATVRRQAKLLNVTLTAAELLKRLKLECSAKSGGNASGMGFMHGK